MSEPRGAAGPPGPPGPPGPHGIQHVTQHIPEKRQSVGPDRRIWLAIAGLVLILAVIVLAVGWATRGESDCPTAKPNQAHSNCT